MLGHLLAVEVGERSQRDSIGDAFAQLAIIPVLHPHQNQRAQRLRCGEAAATLVRLIQAAPQVAAHPLDQRRLLIEKITDHLQQRLKLHALPQQFMIGKTHLPRRRTRHGSTHPAERRHLQANRSAAPPAADIARLFGVTANHPSMRDIARRNGKKNLPPKRWKCPYHRTILPFATETSLIGVDAGGADGFCPARDFLRHKLRQILRRALLGREDFETEFFQPFP